MTPEEELARIGALQQGLNAAWPTFSKWIDERMSDLLLTLIDKDNEQTRGRIKQLRDLKDLPVQLRAQAEALQAPQQVEELP